MIRQFHRHQFIFPSLKNVLFVFALIPGKAGLPAEGRTPAQFAYKGMLVQFHIRARRIHKRRVLKETTIMHRALGDRA